MKVGEAGEAFFVLETDDDVPAELLTSPLLEATKVSWLVLHMSSSSLQCTETLARPSPKSPKRVGLERIMSMINDDGRHHQSHTRLMLPRLPST